MAKRKQVFSCIINFSSKKVARGTVECTFKSKVLLQGDELSVSANAFVLRLIYIVLKSRRCGTKKHKSSDTRGTVGVSKGKSDKL